VFRTLRPVLALGGAFAVAGESALDAAGTVHSDIARGFIRAEIVAGQDLLDLGGMAAARDKGRLRLEGKEYKMADGDVINVRFNV